ncbi:MAG: endolytic transglycosylase MltG [Elusimicrobia bacterium]|nr:endolytic transglycosylase MltG [Elusimicrobiota bacterium]
MVHNKKIAAVAGTTLLAGLLAWELPLMRLTSQQALVKIPRDQKTAREIVGVLAGQGVLKHPRIFLKLTQIFGWDKKFKRGAYLFHTPEAWPMLIKYLTKGLVYSIKITIPEGWTINQIAQRLNEASVTDGEAFARIAYARRLEGYLYPTTYFLEPDSPPEEALEAMLKNFNQIWLESFSDKRAPRNMSMNQVITLASIVEREAMRPEEKPLIAGVFINRLNMGWRLEADPTVQYSLGSWKSRLTYKDTRINSPYNTYKIFGLPPGPIANPSSSSIAAVFEPLETDFMYFVARGDGSHIFFKTLEEHNRFRYLLKKTQRQQNQKK